MYEPARTNRSSQPEDIEPKEGLINNLESSTIPTAPVTDAAHFEVKRPKDAAYWLEATLEERLLHSELAFTLAASRRAITAARELPSDEDLLYECYLERAHAIHDKVAAFWKSDFSVGDGCHEVLYELDRALKLRPERPEAQWWKLYYLRPELSDADVTDVEDVERLGLDDGWYHALLACWRRHLGDDHAAYESARRAVDADSDLAQSWLQRGRAAEAVGNEDEAAADYGEYLKRCGPYREMVPRGQGNPPESYDGYFVSACYITWSHGERQMHELTVAGFECTVQGRTDAMTFAYHLAESDLLKRVAAIQSNECCFNIHQMYNANWQLIDCVADRRQD